MPSIHADTRIGKHISNMPTSIFQSFKWPLALASISAVVIFSIFGALGNNHNNKKTNIPTLENQGLHELIITMQEDDPELVVPNDKVLLVTVYMENCVFCERMEQSTCEEGDVKALLDTDFHRINVDLRDPKYKSFINEYEVKGAPSSLFFGYDGSYLFKLQGFRSPEDYIEHLRIALERSTRDIEDDLHSHDVHQNELAFMNETINLQGGNVDRHGNHIKNDELVTD